ncbi:hypothetical protein L208DRAFT_566437 [Tricholoma matsutake]|nr:hypothetical protein L208DRAFT_566437 [Tricholoma matsutake 945]
MVGGNSTILFPLTRRVPNKRTHRAQRARRCACYFLHFPSISWVHMEYIAVYMVFFSCDIQSIMLSYHATVCTVPVVKI